MTLHFTPSHLPSLRPPSRRHRYTSFVHAVPSSPLPSPPFLLARPDPPPANSIPLQLPPGRAFSSAPKLLVRRPLRPDSSFRRLSDRHGTSNLDRPVTEPHHGVARHRHIRPSAVSLAVDHPSEDGLALTVTPFRVSTPPFTATVSHPAGARQLC
ncbi:hypothetical protein Purlil1_622 [Purpureocillium lilacinum]|uniref:Uncharacterized protein n=1 Tax=Purpureocillium lilacinum TaxID=33203 RepID=A0ABR0CG02_PURLI|nr:hypothetical protein Purlil1_622 [Purpureocillium lilacinum]